MLPDIRFAIGAVLASALLIVSAFGMAATVRVAHHRAVGRGGVTALIGTVLAAFVVLAAGATVYDIGKWLGAW